MSPVAEVTNVGDRVVCDVDVARFVRYKHCVSTERLQAATTKPRLMHDAHSRMSCEIKGRLAPGAGK